MKLFIRERQGDYNREIDLQGSKDPAIFTTYVRFLRDQGGYFTETREGQQIFIPWHRIDYIEEVKNG